MGIRWKSVAELAIAALIVANACELLFFFSVRSEAGLYEGNRKFPSPSGYLLSSRFAASPAAPCFLVRLSSDGCPYCRLDQPQYIQLLKAAQKTGCKAAILAPRAGQLKAAGTNTGLLELQFINMAFGRALNPVITPQTILIKANGSVMWYREGAMDRRALSDALGALRKIR